MIINRSHVPWALFAALVTLGLAAVYLEIFQPGMIPRHVHIPVQDSWGRFPFGHRSVGATPLGIVYGTAAFLIFIFAALLGARKKVRHWRIGPAESWMRAHIWLSILTIPLVAFHCGFRPGSIVTTGLLILYAVVMLSGFYGLALQQFLPGQMMDGVSREVIYDQIPFLRKQLLKSAMELRVELSTRLPGPGRHDKTPVSGQTLASASGATMAATAVAAADPMEDEGREVLREALEADVLPYLRTRRRSRVNLGRKQVADNWFRLLRLSVSERHRARVDEMRKWCEERRQMDLQARLQHWLHYWLFVHVPASLLLLIWTAWHALTGLFYY